MRDARVARAAPSGGTGGGRHDGAVNRGHPTLSRCPCEAPKRRPTPDPERRKTYSNPGFAQNADFTTPPSTRSAAPFVADASGLQT